MTPILTKELEEEIINKKSIWITVFIYLSIFVNSYVLLREPFEFYFGYLVFVILLPVFIYRYGIPRHLFYIFLVLALTGVYNIIIQNNTSLLFLKVYTGLTLSYFFYYYVIVEYNFDLEQLFKWYLKGAYIVSLIGLFQFVSFQVGFKPGYDFSWLFNKWGVVQGGNFGIRVNSVFAEPTYLASTLSAAFFVALYSIFRKEGYYYSKFQSFIIVGLYVLSFSGLGQMGIFLAFILLAANFGLIRYLLLIIPVIIILFNTLYNNVSDFRDRYDGLTGLFSGDEFKLGKTHGSSFILYNNYVVTLKSFKSNYLFGTGIGSHPVSFEKYSLAKNFKISGFNQNSADANSMFLRLLSETGLFGLGLFLFIVFKCYVSRNPEDDSYYWLISNAILVMILLNLFRQGHYFLNGFPFFVLLYYFNYKMYVSHLEGDENSEDIKQDAVEGKTGSIRISHET